MTSFMVNPYFVVMRMSPIAVQHCPELLSRQISQVIHVQGVSGSRVGIVLVDHVQAVVEDLLPVVFVV